MSRESLATEARGSGPWLEGELARAHLDDWIRQLCERVDLERDRPADHDLRFIEWAADTATGAVDDMGIDFCGADVGVTEELLNGSEVVVTF